MISGNMVGSYSQMGKTFILVDENGTELTGVVVDQEAVFTAGDNDVREGKIYASDNGVSTGTKNIPIYRTNAGIEVITPGDNFSISLPNYQQYDYTVFQCMVSLANLSDMNSSVSTNMVAIKDAIYEVNSTIKLADVSKNKETQSIDLNLTNNSDNFYLIHYFTYREEV